MTLEKENFHKEVEEVISRLLRISDAVLKRLMFEVEKEKKHLNFFLLGHVVLFAAYLLTPSIWNLMLIPVSLFLCWYSAKLSRNAELTFKKGMVEIKKIHEEIDEICPLFQQTTVQRWQWVHYRKRKKRLDDKFGIFTDLVDPQDT